MGALASVIITEDFWRQTEPLLMSPHAGLEHWLGAQPAFQGRVFFKTSGSTGEAKYVCLSRAALRASARMVNAHLEATGADRWLGALPQHHVGGFGVAARASESGSAVSFLTSAWNPLEFCQAVTCIGATLTSLVPTQVFDLVAASSRAPSTLRAVLVGGGALESGLEREARAMGWPLLKTFGMTETASQIATQPLGSDQDSPLVLLPGWEADTNPEGFLRVRGEALFSGYILGDGDSYHVDAARDEQGWFVTPDLVRLDGNSLVFVGRSGHRLKIKGELVNLAALRLDLEAAALACGQDPLASTVIAVPHLRDEHTLVLVTESQLSEEQREHLRQRYDSAVNGLVRLQKAIAVPQLPRTALGKLEEAALEREVKARMHPQSLP